MFAKVTECSECLSAEVLLGCDIPKMVRQHMFTTAAVPTGIDQESRTETQLRKMQERL